MLDPAGAEDGEKRPRREYGSGTLTEIKPRLWRLRAPAGIDVATGRTRQVSRNFRASKPANRGGRGEALEALRKLVEEVGSGRHVGTSADFNTLSAEYLRHVKRLREPSTYDSYRIRLERSVLPTLGPVKLAQLTAHHLDRLYEDLAEAGLASTTIEHAHAVISGALSQAVDWGWIATNPAKRATPPVGQPKERAALDPLDVRRLIEAARAEDVDMAILIYLLCLCGGRRGEACGFQWGDVDWERRAIHVERQIVPGPGGQRVVPYPKGGVKKKRIEAIGEAGARILLGYQQHLRERLAEWEPSPTGWLVSPDGGATPLRAKGVTGYMERLGGRLDPPVEVRPHDFRRFSATQLGLAGVPLRTIMDRLGHSSIEVAQRYHLPVSASDIEAAEILGALLELEEEPRAVSVTLELHSVQQTKEGAQ